MPYADVIQVFVDWIVSIPNSVSWNTHCSPRLEQGSTTVTDYLRDVCCLPLWPHQAPTLGLAKTALPQTCGCSCLHPFLHADVYLYGPPASEPALWRILSASGHCSFWPLYDLQTENPRGVCSQNRLAIMDEVNFSFLESVHWIIYNE